MANEKVKIGLAGFAVVLLVIILIFALHIDVPLWAMAILGIVAMIALLAPVVYVKPVRADISDSVLHVSGSGVDVSVDLRDIKSAELRESLSVGNVVKGSSNGWMVSGRCTTPEFGEYTMCGDTDLPAFIVVKHIGDVLVFNLKTVEGTQKIFEEIKAGMPERPRRR